MNKIKKISVVILFLFCFTPSLSLAVSNVLTPDKDLPGSTVDNWLIRCGDLTGNFKSTDGVCEFDDLIRLVQNGLNFVFAFAAFIAAAMFMYAGFLMIPGVSEKII